MTETREASLYDRIGGADAVSKLLVDFYERVLVDDALAPFFAHVPIDKLRTMQREFFAAALDGPISYHGRSLSEIHAGLGIRPVHLRRFLEHLMATLEGMDVDQDDRYEIYSRIAMRADEITGESAVDG